MNAQVDEKVEAIVRTALKFFVVACAPDMGDDGVTHVVDHCLRCDALAMAVVMGGMTICNVSSVMDSPQAKADVKRLYEIVVAYFESNGEAGPLTPVANHVC